MLSLKFNRWGSETVGAKHTCCCAGLWLVGPISMAGVDGAGEGGGRGARGGQAADGPWPAPDCPGSYEYKYEQGAALMAVDD